MSASADESVRGAPEETPQCCLSYECEADTFIIHRSIGLII